MQQRFLKSLKNAVPTILSCVGAAGVVVTGVLTARAAPKALDRVNAAKEAKMAEKGEEITPLETIAASWRTYTPAGIAGMATIGCIFGSNLLNRHQQASLVATCAFLERSIREYKKSVKNVFGKDGYDRVVNDILVQHPEPSAYYDTTSGQRTDFEDENGEKHLFYDTFSRQYFDASFADVLLAEIHTNRVFANNGGETSIETFYDALGIETPDDLKGLNWFVCENYYFIDFTHTKHLVDDGPDREPIECWVIEMLYPPTMEPIED